MNLAGKYFKGFDEDGQPLHLSDDGPLTIKLGDDDPVTYWAKRDGDDPETGAPRYKLLPMERS